MPKKKQPVNTFARTRAWIKANFKPGSQDKRKPHELAMWFFAWREAESGAYSELRTKDIAHLLLTGLPKLTPADIDDALLAEDEGDTEFDAQDLTQELREFWGVK